MVSWRILIPELKAIETISFFVPKKIDVLSAAAVSGIDIY